jgi:hypothetical protein
MRQTALVFALALAYAGCGGSNSGGSPSTPTPTPTSPTATNRSPSIASMSVTPTFGVSSVTTFSMSASATDADGDTLDYQWSFGGKAASGSTQATTMAGDGNVVVQLTVSDGKGGTATDSRAVTVANMSGEWTFMFTPVCNNVTVRPILTLVQTGNVVAGDLRSPAAWCNVPAGQSGKFDPASPANIDSVGKFDKGRLKIGSYQDTFLTGSMDASGRVITGTCRFTAGTSCAFEMRKM